MRVQLPGKSAETHPPVRGQCLLINLNHISRLGQERSPLSSLFRIEGRGLPIGTIKIDAGRRLQN